MSVGSSPAKLTSEILVVKKCDCTNPMYIHQKGDEHIFTGCEVCIIDIRLEKGTNDDILIKGKRSTKRVRCSGCKTRTHLISSFEEVKDGVSRS